jgi:hypothetical protein
VNEIALYYFKQVRREYMVIGYDVEVIESPYFLPYQTYPTYLKFPDFGQSKRIAPGFWHHG